MTNPKFATFFYVFAAPFTKVVATKDTKIFFDVDGKQVIPKVTDYQIKEDAWHIHLTPVPAVLDVEPMLPMPAEQQRAFKLGEQVQKTGGDYAFSGAIVAIFTKIGGAQRYVVENSDGLLLIQNEAQLARYA